MASDVLDHNDGVVDENTDREDQREEAHPVQRVAHDAGGEEREENGGGNDDGNHQRLAPADGDRHEEDDGNCREPQMEEKLVGLIVCRFAIVPRDGDGEVGGDERALKLLQSRGDAFGDDHGVGARALGQRQRHGRQRGGAGRRLHHIGGTDLATVSRQQHLRHVTHIDGPPVACRDQDVCNVGG